MTKITDTNHVCVQCGEHLAGCPLCGGYNEVRKLTLEEIAKDRKARAETEDERARRLERLRQGIG